MLVLHLSKRLILILHLPKAFLGWLQTQTMKMMYGVIVEALRDVGMLGERHPRDYLNFYCLGNREVQSQVEIDHPPPNPSDENSKHVSVLFSYEALF